MQRVNIGKTLSFLMFFWGVIVLCTGFATNWATLMALRALQGAAECTISCVPILTPDRRFPPSN